MQGTGAVGKVNLCVTAHRWKSSWVLAKRTAVWGFTFLAIVRLMSCHRTGLSEVPWQTKLLGCKLWNTCGYHKQAWAELAFVFWLYMVCHACWYSCTIQLICIHTKWLEQPFCYVRHQAAGHPLWLKGDICSIHLCAARSFPCSSQIGMWQSQVDTRLTLLAWNLNW